MARVREFLEKDPALASAANADADGETSLHYASMSGRPVGAPRAGSRAALSTHIPKDIHNGSI